MELVSSQVKVEKKSFRHSAFSEWFDALIPLLLIRSEKPDLILHTPLTVRQKVLGFFLMAWDILMLKFRFSFLIVWVATLCLQV